MMEEMKKRKWGRIGCLGIVAATVVTILVVIAGVYYYNKTYGMNRAEQTVTEYLQEKYNREFVVANGHYIWATGTYTFDASPKDDPEFKFPVFSGSRFYDNSVGDMYGLAREGRETHKLIDPFVNAISKNNCYSANFDSGLEDKDPYPIMLDIRRNSLTPLQAASKYPGKIYLNAGISYALDVTDTNKEQIFKGVYNLIEFLEQKNFGYIGVVIYFYPSDILGGKTIKSVYGDNGNQFEDKYWKKRTYSIAIGTKVLPDIKKWQDIGNYFEKRDAKNNRWIKDENLESNSNDNLIEKEIGK